MANEKRLIDAEAIDYENIMCSQSQLHWLNAIIERQPTVDAVEVVRCRDCEYFFNLKCHARILVRCTQDGIEIQHQMTGENDFCSYGEKRDMCGTQPQREDV